MICSHHMESLPIKYFDTHAHGDIMSDLHERYRYAASDDQPEYATAAYPVLITIVSVFVSMLILSIPLTSVYSGDGRHHAVLLRRK